LGGGGGCFGRWWGVGGGGVVVGGLFCGGVKCWGWGGWFWGVGFWVGGGGVVFRALPHALLNHLSSLPVGTQRVFLDGLIF